MALIIKRSLESYSNVLNELADPRSKDFLLMGSPIYPILCVILYNYFVLKLGPALMKNREPFNLDKVMMAYNLLQIFCNGYLFINIVSQVMKQNPVCSPVDYSVTPENLRICQMSYYYFLLKLFDFFDTICFVLRKNTRQISFLHVYHHSGMVFVTWLCAKFIAGGQSIYLPFLNTFVHVIMYFYYFLTNLNPENKKNIWWKKHITQMQLIQFAGICYFSIRPLLESNCAYPKWPAIGLFPNNLMIFILFCDFYRKNYWKSSKINSD